MVLAIFTITNCGNAIYLLNKINEVIMNTIKIFEEAVKLKASDIHLTVGLPPIFRIHGELIQYNEYKLKPHHSEAVIKEITTDSQWNFLKEKGELDFSYSLQGICRFRINAYRQRDAYSLSARIIPTEIPSISGMNLPESYKYFASLKRGLVLFTGPTGSGKSTSLAAIIDHINKTRNVKILTIEDPIEFLHSHGGCIVDQREVGQDSKDYETGLRAALRQDPDVILLGEMRDLDSISIAMTAAETGHLVFSTLHTKGAISAVDRIIDAYPANQQNQVRLQLSTVIEGVVSQQLLKKSEGGGRLPAIEVMVANPAIRNYIREGKTTQILNVMQTNKGEGMMTMDNAIYDLFTYSHITKEEAVEHAYDRKYLMSKM